MTFSRGLSNGWLEGTNHPRLTHGKFGKKRGALLGKVARSGNGWFELEPAGNVPLAVDDGVVFDSGEDRNEEQGGRVWKLQGPRIYLLRRSQVDWDRVKPGQTIWKTDDPVLNKELKQRWKSARPKKKRAKVNVVVSGKAGDSLTLSCGTVEVASEHPLERAEKRPLDDAFLRKQLGRLGDTGYELGTVENRLDGEVMLPVSAINELRRRLVEMLDNSTTVPVETIIRPTLGELLPEREPPSEQASKLSVLCRSLAQIEAALKTNIPTIYCDFEDLRRYKDAVSQVREHEGKSKIYLATPRIQKTKESGYFKLIAGAEPDGVLLRNLGGVRWF